MTDRVDGPQGPQVSADSQGFVGMVLGIRIAELYRYQQDETAVALTDTFIRQVKGRHATIDVCCIRPPEYI
jgi:hypothetical protein